MESVVALATWLPIAHGCRSQMKGIALQCHGMSLWNQIFGHFRRLGVIGVTPLDASGRTTVRLVSEHSQMLQPQPPAELLASEIRGS